MPRQVRVQYEGAIYHVMARGNRLDKIVRSDGDREVFEATIEDVVGRTGWRVYAYKRGHGRKWRGCIISLPLFLAVVSGNILAVLRQTIFQTRH